MSMSLRDQLIQAGLGTKKQVKETGKGKRPLSRHQPQPLSAEKLAANQAAAAKNARDQELNRKQQEKAAAKARRAQVRQLIEQSRLPPVQSELYFNFADGTRLARLAVTPQLREQLISGKVVVVRYEGHYAMVPEAAVERIRERDEHSIVPYVAPAETVDKDDPYKDFVVPDDLVW